MRTVMKFFLGAMIMAVSAPALAMPDMLEEDVFGTAPVADEVLAQKRGGFITVGGLQIDFALTTRTLIDGVLERDLTVRSTSLQGLDVDQLRQVIQIGQNNDFQSLDEVLNNPGVVTVIQNSADDRVIQNFNVLDLNVSNVDQVKASQPVTDFLTDQTTFLK